MCFIALAITRMVSGATIHVDDTNGDDVTGDGSIANPYKAIQKGLATAVSGDVIEVAAGTYKGIGNTQLDFAGKAITLRSSDGAATTIIDCENSVTGIDFNDAETAAATIEGFTITNAAEGGIKCSISSSPTIQNCIIARNTGGIVVDRSDPTLINCEIVGNTQPVGGGLHLVRSDATLINCLIVENSATSQGGAIYATFGSSVTMVNCTIAANTAQNSAIYCANASQALITNCILWNQADNELDIERGAKSYVTYSNVQAGCLGTANINHDPQFVSPTEGDYRLKLNSPCIDAGDNNAVVNVAADLDTNERRIDDPGTPDTGNGSRPIVDMGAYEFRRTLFIDVAAATGGDGTSWATAYNTIQEGLSAASNSNLVLVAPGTYRGAGNKQLDFAGKAITLKSAEGAAATIIDCEASGTGIDFVNDEPQSAVVDGFTITNANNSGIRCSTGADPTIQNCILTGNSATCGGGVYVQSASDPNLINCLIVGNSGDAVYVQTAAPTLTNCTIADNIGHGVYYKYSATGSVINCIICSNSGDEIKLDSTGGPTVAYTNIEGSYAGTGNINCDPQFICAVTSDYRLRCDSPCIDAGDNNAVARILTDLDGTPRRIDHPEAPDTGNGDQPIVDMGAYEFTPFAIVSWESVRTHGTAGAAVDYAIQLDPSDWIWSGLNGPTVEPRKGGVRTIRVRFSEPVALSSGKTHADIKARDMTGNTIAAWAAELSDGNTVLDIHFQDINGDSVLSDPDGSTEGGKTYRIDLKGLIESSTESVTLVGDMNCLVRVLLGDVNADGKTDAADETVVSNLSGVALDQDTCVYDIDLDGDVDEGFADSDKALISSNYESTIDWLFKPTRLELLGMLEVLPELPKVHYAWPLREEAITSLTDGTNDTDDLLLMEYIRISRSIPLGINCSQAAVNAAVEMANEISAVTPWAPQVSLSIEFSPYHSHLVGSRNGWDAQYCSDQDPNEPDYDPENETYRSYDRQSCETYAPLQLAPVPCSPEGYAGTQTDHPCYDASPDLDNTFGAEVDAFADALSDIITWLADANTHHSSYIEITAVLLDCEHWHFEDLDNNYEPDVPSEYNDALDARYDAIYNVVLVALPNAMIEWFGRRACCRYTLRESGEYFSTSLYRKVDQATENEAKFNDTHLDFTDYNTTHDPNLAGIVVWLSPAMDYYADSVCDPTRITWCGRFYNPLIDWNLGATFNDNRYPDRPAGYQGWQDVSFLCFWPEPFCIRFGLDDMQWGLYFAAYVSGAHGLR
jgi:parallel beta-helix repeat protein/predicted outer membrane repeat protein